MIGNKLFAIDLCCGLGGISLASKRLKISPLIGVDINKSALKTYKHNFPKAIVLEGSILDNEIVEECIRIIGEKQLSPEQLVIISGPPCQGFSIAGRRDPNDPRNDILPAVAKIISKIRPKYALIENVSFLLSDIYNNKISELKKIIRRAGYNEQTLSLDAQNFGVAQRRKRVFFLISKKNNTRDKIVNRLKKLQKPTPSTKNILGDLPIPRKRPMYYSDALDTGPIFNHFRMIHSKQVIEKISNIRPGKGPLSYRRLHPNMPASTLISGHRAPPAHYSQPRSITVREAARLQGFPDGFKICGNFGSQMEQVTNAVPPPLAEAVLRVLIGD